MCPFMPAAKFNFQCMSYQGRAACCNISSWSEFISRQSASNKIPPCSLVIHNLLCLLHSYTHASQNFSHIINLSLMQSPTLFTLVSSLSSPFFFLLLLFFWQVGCLSSLIVSLIISSLIIF